MAGPIQRGNLPRAMRPGLHDIAGMSYEIYPDKSAPLFEHNVSKLMYEEEIMITTMGLAHSMTENQAITFDDMKQSYSARYTHGKYGLGFSVTEEEVDDNLYKSAADFRAAGLGWALKQTKNYNGANIFNFGFDPLHPIGDLGAFFRATHTTESGNQSNVLTVAAELSEAALEDILIQIYDTRDNRNKKIMLREKLLLIPADLEFDASRLLQNPQRPGTADRDINAMNVLGKFPGGIVVNHFLTDPDAWMVPTTCPHGLKYFERRAVSFDEDNDFHTSNMYFKMWERYSFGLTDWRCCFASAGG